jgi:hypothetical protein
VSLTTSTQQAEGLRGEVYLDTPQFDSIYDEAVNPDQPFVLSNGDNLGCSVHADCSSHRLSSNGAHLTQTYSDGKRDLWRRSFRNAR